MPTVIDLLPPELWRYVSQIPPIWLINAVFAAWLWLCLYVAYYGTRRGLGHEKYKGQWYNGDQLQLLKQELYSGVRAGRIPDSQTMAFLDRHVYGKESEIRRLNGNGWL